MAQHLSKLQLYIYRYAKGIKAEVALSGIKKCIVTRVK